MTRDAFFKRALPVWAAGRSREMNAAMRLAVEIPVGNRSAALRITACSLYRFRVGGAFGGFGPARAAHGHFRVDEWPLALSDSAIPTLITVEAVGYNINSYCWPMHPAFVQAEIEADGEIIAATGGGGFTAFTWPERVQRVERYSAARSFSEVYRLGEVGRAPDPVELEILPRVRLLPRRVPYPAFIARHPKDWLLGGATERYELAILHRDWTLDCIGPDLLGYPEHELEVIPSLDIQRFRTVRLAQPASGSRPDAVDLRPLEFAVARFDHNMSGFIGATISCEEAATVYVTFDEILTDGGVDWKRLRCNNIVTLMLQPGRYDFETIEPYTLRYLQVMPVGASVRVGHIGLREYAAPVRVAAPLHLTGDERRVFDASMETYRQNAVDLLTDCPSRERAGWLCDSFFSARTERSLTGASVVEHAFLENYRLHNQSRYLPDGMLPMCYPADHPNGKFIPNWALWYVLQLEEYVGRTGDRTECDLHLPLVEGVLQYFEKFRNEDGLLESLEGWVFVEWSAANDFVQDVNYPTNMLYAAALEAASRLFGSAELSRAAGSIRRRILDQSFDGEWFCDNAVRAEAGLVRSANRTEVCQYYAFYFGVTSPSSHPELWRRLVEELGPERNGLHPEIHPANALNGIMLRLELLARHGLNHRLRKELTARYLPMAELTGTLWEHADTSASCCHGFQSYAGVLLAEAAERG